MTILDYIRRNAEHCPDKVAITDKGDFFTYGEVYSRMTKSEQLPIPLLGEAWDGDFTLHTTGTTGEPKAVTIKQERVLRDSLNLIRAHGYRKGIQFIIAGPMTHLGCWSKIFPTLIVGGTLHILLDGMKDLDAFYEIMRKGEQRYATFLVPSALHMLIQLDAKRLGSMADRIDFIETGAAPMPHEDMVRLCQILPRTRLYNTYASTEQGIVATYNYNDGGICTVKKAGCCGVPFDNVGFTINKEGIIDGSNDLGYLDEEGLLHIVGRQDDMINVGGLKVSPVEVEEAALLSSMVQDCMCVPRSHPLMGQVPALLLVMKHGATLDKKTLARHLLQELGETHKVPLYYEVVDSIPYTFNGKRKRN